MPTTTRPGWGCPVGAHIRRANPRDALDPDTGPDQSIRSVNRHRLLRRGRAYHEPSDPSERGIHFICLSANIARQFEFVQHTWLNNPKFAGLYDDTDPLVATHQGDAGRIFTVQARPFRQRVTGLPPFVTVKGGAYFFLPGLRRCASWPGWPQSRTRTSRGGRCDPAFLGPLHARRDQAAQRRRGAVHARGAGQAPGRRPGDQRCRHLRPAHVRRPYHRDRGRAARPAWRGAGPVLRKAS